MSLLVFALAFLQPDIPPAALRAAREQADAQRSKIAVLLDAMKRRDESAFKAAGGSEIAYSSTLSSGLENIRPDSPRLELTAFDGLASCTAGRPQFTGTDWYSVIWDCPGDGPVSDAQYSFKFAGDKLIAVVATRLPPRILSVKTNG